MRPWFLLMPLMIACGGGSDTDTDTDTTPDTDTDTDTDATAACEAEISLTHGEGGCFGYDDAWEFKADVAGCGEQVILNAWRTDGEAWDEQHPMVLHDEGPDRVWQSWFGGPLQHQAGTDAWVPGESSALDCQADTGKVTFALRVFDSAGAQRACAVFGHAPDHIVAGHGSALNSDDPSSFADCVIREW